MPSHPLPPICVTVRALSHDLRVSLHQRRAITHALTLQLGSWIPLAFASASYSPLRFWPPTRRSTLTFSNCCRWARVWVASRDSPWLDDYELKSSGLWSTTATIFVIWVFRIRIKRLLGILGRRNCGTLPDTHCDALESYCDAAITLVWLVIRKHLDMSGMSPKSEKKKSFFFRALSRSNFLIEWDGQ